MTSRGVLFENSSVGVDDATYGLQAQSRRIQGMEEVRAKVTARVMKVTREAHVTRVREVDHLLRSEQGGSGELVV